MFFPFGIVKRMDEEVLALFRRFKLAVVVYVVTVAASASPLNAGTTIPLASIPTNKNRDSPTNLSCFTPRLSKNKTPLSFLPY